MSFNRSNVKTRPTPWDAAVVAAVVLLGVAVAMVFYGPKTTGSALTCVVTVDGQVADRAPLADFQGQHAYTGNGHALTIEVSGSQVKVLVSDCPGQDCVHVGAISRAGQSLVCLPAHIVIHLESGGDSPDLVVG